MLHKKSFREYTNGTKNRSKNNERYLGVVEAKGKCNAKNVFKMSKKC